MARAACPLLWSLHERTVTQQTRLLDTSEKARHAIACLILAFNREPRPRKPACQGWHHTTAHTPIRHLHRAGCCRYVLVLLFLHDRPLPIGTNCTLHHPCSIAASPAGRGRHRVLHCHRALSPACREGTPLVRCGVIAIPDQSSSTRACTSCKYSGRYLEDCARAAATSTHTLHS